ncbi:MAG TPA: cation:proton antiporter [Candidatus Sulfomarinibacteraceae bacterium]|nr:cation:proton antiporter [Candidatus Sulfomarinibacteraceae bacterium]
MEFSIVNLLLVLLAAWVAGNVVARMGYPSIFGELMAGIILGPPLLGLLHGSEALSVLAEVGVLLMMLYIGMEIDHKELFKASWAGTLAALGGFFTPFALVYFFVVALGGTPAAGLFVGIAAGITSLATKSRILVDLKLLDTRVAHVLMAGALISDTLALIAFAVIIGVVDVGALNVTEIGLVALRATLFFGLVTLLGLKVFPVLWRRLKHRGLTGRTFNATLILLIALLFAEFAELAGLHAILGAFLAGLFLREGTVLEPKLSHQLNELVHDVSIGFLAPVFFVTAGFHVSLGVFQTDLLLLAGVTVLATLGKVVGTAVFYLPSGNGWREGIVVGAGMNGRGAVEIIIAEIGLTMGLISQEIFSILVFMAIFTTALVPLFLKWGTDWLRSRGQLVRSRDRRHGVVIVGAGPTARTLAKALGDGEPVWLLDKNRAHCAAAEAEGLTAICGDALDVEALDEAHVGQANTFLALTPNAEVNVMSARLAQEQFRTPEVHALLPVADDSLRSLADISGVHAIDHWIDLEKWDHWISSQQVSEIFLDVDDGVQQPETVMVQTDADDPTVPLVVARNGQRIPFPSADHLDKGDQVLAMQRRRPQ